MVTRRDVAAWVIAAAVVFSGALVAQKKDDKKQSEAQKKEIQDIVKTVDAVAAGQAAPNDFGLTWVREDFLKAQGNKQYVPFSVSADTSKVAGPNIAFYWRVVAPLPPAPAPATNGKKDEKKAPAPQRFAYEDLAFIPVTP